MTDPRRPEPTQNEPERSQEWAPWWIYLVVLLGANYLRAAILPGDSLPLSVIVVIALGQAGALFVVVTAIWRLTQRGDD